MLGEPDRWSRGASQFRGALLFCTRRTIPGGVIVPFLFAIALQAYGGQPPRGLERPVPISGDVHRGKRFDKPIGRGLIIGAAGRIANAPAASVDDRARPAGAPQNIRCN